MKPRVYVETSVISYLTARPSRDLLTLARQQFTADWWDLHGAAFDAFISLLVIDEVGCGDVVAASRRLSVCEFLPRLEIDQRAQTLADLLIEQHAIPASEPDDALHIATATVHGVDYLASWNFVHLVGASAKFRLQQHIAGLGWAPPIIATPEELLEEML